MRSGSIASDVVSQPQPAALMSIVIVIPTVSASLRPGRSATSNVIAANAVTRAPAAIHSRMARSSIAGTMLGSSEATPTALVGAVDANRAPSLSTMVTTPVLSPNVALPPLGIVSRTENVSVDSAFLSLTIVIVIVLVATPAANASEPDAAVKSDPATAVPADVDQLTVEALAKLPLRVTVNVTVTVGPPLLPSVTVASVMVTVGGAATESLSAIVPVPVDGEPTV